MEGEMQPRDEAQALAELAAIWARFGALVTTLTQARTECKELRGFLIACGYDDPSYLADLGVSEISLAAMTRHITRLSKIYEPEAHTPQADGLLERQAGALTGRQEHSAGAILRRQREERGWSLEEVVRQIGRLYQQENGKQCPLTISMVGKWERAEHIPTPTYRKLFCLLYQQTASQLGFLPARSPAIPAQSQVAGGGSDRNTQN